MQENRRLALRIKCLQLKSPAKVSIPNLDEYTIPASLELHSPGFSWAHFWEQALLCILCFDLRGGRGLAGKMLALPNAVVECPAVIRTFSRIRIRVKLSAALVLCAPVVAIEHLFSVDPHHEAIVSA